MRDRARTVIVGRRQDSFGVDGEPCWCGGGGIEVATTPERMQELKRRLGFARSYLSRGRRAAHSGGSGGEDPAAGRGVAFEGGVTATGFDIRDGGVHGVRTDRGTSSASGG